MCTCAPPQVAVEYGVVTRSVPVAAWYSILMVEMVVSTAAVSTLGDLIAGHAYIGRVAEFETVLAH